LPVNQIRATGTLAKDGKLQMETISMDSPQLKLNAVGEVKNAKSRDLLGEPLQVNASLAASSDIAIMLDGMNLLEKGDSKGFLKMKQPFTITGSVGQPNLQPLYDLLARAVDNSHGSWGLLMRKVQGMVPKAAPKPGS
jgi:hydroxypyruvate isomerase